MSKFKVGDFVVRNNTKHGSLEDYNWTNKDAGKMLVTQIADKITNKKFTRRILNHIISKNKIGLEYNDVDEKYFDLATPTIQLNENSTELERWMVLLNE